MKRSTQYTIALSVMALTAYGGAVWSRLHGLWACFGTQASIADFVLYYMLGSLAAGPQHLSLYSPDVQLAYQNQLLAPCHLERVFYCQYFPFLVPLLTLLSFMPISLAYVVWAGLQICLFVVTLRWFLQRTADVSAQASWIFVLAAVAALPTVDNFHLGQLSGFITVAALFYCWGLLLDKFAAGIGLAILTWKIQLFFPLATMSLSMRRWKLVSVAAITAILLAAAAGMLIGWDNILRYPSIVMRADQFKETGVYPERMVCIRGLLSLFIDHRLGLRIAMGIFAAVTGLAWAAWLRVPVRSSLDFRWRIALMVVLTLIVSPHVHLHDCMLLVIPATLTVPSLLAESTRTRAQSYWLNSLMSYPILSWLYFVPPIIDIPSIYSVLTLVFLCSLLIAGWRCRMDSLQATR